MRKKIAINGINTDDCPCKACHEKHESYLGCHSDCKKYLEWQEQHKTHLDSIQKQRDLDDVLYRNQVSRNRKVHQDGGLHYGRSNDTR